MNLFFIPHIQLLFLLTILTTFLKFSNQQDLTYSVGNLTLNFYKLGGKLEFLYKRYKFNNVTNQVDITQDKITHQLISIKELNEQGSDLLNKDGESYHLLNQLENTTFTFTQLKEIVYDKLNCTVFYFYINNLFNYNTTVKTTVMVARNDGSLKIGSREVLDLSAGELGIEYLIFNWPFCKNENLTSTKCQTDPRCCIGVNDTNLEGRFLEMVMKTEGNMTIRKNSTFTNTYFLGNGWVTSSAFITLDTEGSPTELDKSYPKINEDSTISVRFSNFSTFAEYGLIFEFEEDLPLSTTIIYAVLGFIVAIMLISAGIANYVFSQVHAIENGLVPRMAKGQ